MLQEQLDGVFLVTGHTGRKNIKISRKHVICCLSDLSFKMCDIYSSIPFFSQKSSC